MARLPVLDLLSNTLYPGSPDFMLPRGHEPWHLVRLSEGLFVLAGVVDQGVTLVEGVARGDLADYYGMVTGAGSVYDLAVEVGQAVEKEGRATRCQAVGDALELVVVLAARVREVGSDVYLIVAQYAKGEGLALEYDVVGVTVALDCYRHAGGAFGGLHNPRGRHGVGLAAASGSHHVDPVGQVTEGRRYGVTVSEVPVQSTPSGRDTSILSGAVYCGPCRSPDGKTHERAPDLVRHTASRDLPPLHAGDRPLRKGAATLRDPRVRVGFRRGDDGLPGLQYALPAHPQLGDEREDRQLFHRGRGGARGRGVLEGSGPAPDLLYRLQYGPETFLVRRIFGGFAHASFTSLTGIGLGLVPWVQSRVLKVVLPVLGLMGAILLHATFNFMATVFGPVGYLVLFCVILVYVVVIIVWLAIERRAIREELRDEVPTGTITSQEYAILPSYFRTTGYFLELIFTGRLGTWFRARKLNATAVDLALAKRLARRSGSPGSMDRVRMLRQKILDMREGATVRAAS